MAGNLARNWDEPHSRRSAPARDPAAELAQLHAGDADLAAELAQRRAWLHARRWPPRERNPWLWLIIAVIVLVHVAWVVALRSASRPHPAAPREEAIAIRLIDEAPPPALAASPREMEPLVVYASPTGNAANSPAPARSEAPARPVAAPAAQKDAHAEVEAIVATPRLYNPDGSLSVPRTEAVPKARDALSRGLAAAAELRSRGHNVVRCRSTRFAGAWKPDESVGEQVSRKYLSYVGLYNPHSAQKAAERAAEATEACDETGP